MSTSVMRPRSPGLLSLMTTLQQLNNPEETGKSGSHASHQKRHDNKMQLFHLTLQSIDACKRTW